MKMLLVVLLVVLEINQFPGDYDGRRRARLVKHQHGQRGQRPPRRSLVDHP